MWKVYASIPNHTYPETIHIKNYFAPDSSLVDQSGAAPSWCGRSEAGVGGGGHVV